MSQPKRLYKFYPSLLDGFQGWIDSDSIWDKYWGKSENPKISMEEFEVQQRQSFIDKVNRVPFTSAAAEKGTAFNDLVDLIADGTVNPETMVSLNLEHNGFLFDREFTMNFAQRYRGALHQQYVEATIECPSGTVMLYGFVDEVVRDWAEDIKTTSGYELFKYERNWQHHVYPYCLNEMGVECNGLVYRVAEIKEYATKVNYRQFNEDYSYNEAYSVPAIISVCERMIGFLEQHRHLITDEKVFGGEKKK